MAMSGVEIDQEVVTVYEDVKLRKTHKWITFKISDDKKKVEIDQRGEKITTESKEEDKAFFNTFTAQHFKAEPRYAVYDFRFTNKESRVIEAICFICWNPDDGKIKPKMLYASTKDALKKKLTGLKEEFQVNDRSDLDYDTFLEKLD